MGTWAVPEHSRREVNRAGEIFKDDNTTLAQKEAALAVINNWRASHNFPLNTFQIRLRKLAKEINPESLVAQRIKRLASIRLKFERFPNMQMAQLQDIGGCRAILQNVEEVDQLVSVYLNGRSSRGIRHKLAKMNDYITTPASSGYRGIHLIYKYNSDKSVVYQDMRIEIQIRTLMQHAWATAVETVGTFIRQSLKSSQGEKEWLWFFKCMSSAMAIIERKPSVEGTPQDEGELKAEITRLSRSLDVEGRLRTFRDSIQVLGTGAKGIPNAHYYLLDLDATSRKVYVRSYSQAQLSIASSDYVTLEKRINDHNRDAVLVSAESVDALRLAFPNYYLDTDFFLAQLKSITAMGQLSLF